MAIIDIYPDVQASNPVGWINMNPLPTLPSGLERAYLLRTSLRTCSRSLTNTGISTTEASVSEVILGSEGSHEYTSESFFTDRRGAGLLYADWSVVDNSDEFTWMFVGQHDGPVNNSAQIRTSQFSPGNGFLVTYFNNEIRFSTRSGSGGDPETTSVDLTSSTVSTPVMGFATFNKTTNEAAVYSPSADNFESQTLASWDAPSQTGILVGASASDFDGENNNRQYMVAQWDRVLSQVEMSSVYNTLKPWLSGRGVDIE